MKHWKQIIFCGLAAAAALAHPVTTLAAGEEAALSEMELVAENESLELYYDETEAGLAVRDKASGEIWCTSPADSDQDTVSTAYYQKVLKSQVNITYINESTQVSTMNSYADAVADGQFEAELIEDGIRITYTMGEGGKQLLLPTSISEERMLQFQQSMTEEQIKKINRNYVLDEETRIYTLRGGVKDYLQENMAEYFAEAGYTQEDYELDMANAEDSSDEKEWFSVPVTYVLDGDNLVVSVNPEEVTYNTDGYYLVTIDLLRYFGASMSDDGYLFVPDGSGALIDFNNGKTTANSYTAAVYGADATMQSMNWYESELDASNTVRMPVYGVKDGDKALFAIIEDGDAYATINADVAGKTTGYNDVYASFTYLQYGETSLDDIVGSNSYYMYSEADFAGNYTIRYAFLTGEDADYSGMARYYREYLVENGVLTDRVSEDGLPFYAEYIGAIDKDKTLLGIKYEATEAVTTFAQASEITLLLADAGITNLNVVYAGWSEGGLHGEAVTSLNVESKLKKSGYGIDDFLDDMAGNSVYFTADLQYVYEDGMFDGYSTMKYSPKYFDNTNATILAYGLASRQSDGTLANLISPYFADSITNKAVKKMTKYGITGLNLGTMSYELYSDLYKNRYTDRQQAELNYAAAAQTAAESMTLLGDNANAYLWGTLTEVINAPMYSNGYRILDHDVPFYEMVLHGYVQYAGQELNLCDDYETAVLKSAESGAGIHFKWIYADNSVVKETNYDDLYSVNYEAWIEKAEETYNRLNADLGALSGLTITKHVYLTDTLVCVTYEDGTKVYVNYGTEAADADGVSVPARDYLVEGI